MITLTVAAALTVLGAVFLTAAWLLADPPATTAPVFADTTPRPQLPATPQDTGMHWLAGALRYRP